MRRIVDDISHIKGNHVARVEGRTDSKVRGESDLRGQNQSAGSNQAYAGSVPVVGGARGSTGAMDGESGQDNFLTPLEGLSISTIIIIKNKMVFGN